MPVNSPDPGTWRGWLRPPRSRKWTAVVEADSENRVWARLLDFAGRGDRAVLPAGRDPNTERPR